MSGPAPTRVTVLGEALIDFVPAADGVTFTARPGGSPFNVAVGLARLGTPTTLMARIPVSPLGQILRRHAAASGVDLSCAPAAVEPTTLALVSVDDQGAVGYDFYLEGTADWGWTAAELDHRPPATTVLHFGSIASWRPPAAERIAAMVEQVRAGSTLVSYDPNVRPLVLGTPERARVDIERSIRLAHLVKASTEDVAWLYPDEAVDDVARRWLDLGAAVVVLTRGVSGAMARAASGAVADHPGLPVGLVDAVGAGDAFTSGLIASLAGAGHASVGALSGIGSEVLVSAVADAILTSALTCERVGADPPTGEELRAARHRAGPREPAEPVAGDRDKPATWR